MTVGWFGQLHPREAAARKIKEPVFVGELYLDRLYKLPLRKPMAREISPLPARAPRFLPRSGRKHRMGPIDRALAGSRIPELVEWRAREVFRDPTGRARSTLALLGATFQAPDRTLREEELQNFQARVVEAVGKVGARLRS